jgi:hypothetical protein
MNILVLYFKWKTKRDRNTVDEHLYCFKRYIDDIQFHYFNGANGIPWYLTKARFDCVILHYTFLATRWSRSFYLRWNNAIKNLKRIPGYKVAIPQDEYAESDTLCDIFNEYAIGTVFTCFGSHDYARIYSKEKVTLEHLITVLPGYIDENAVNRLKFIDNKNTDRPIDLGYRARRLPFWLGRHGQLKYEIGQVFLEKTKDSGLRVDISTDEREAFLGKDWYRFLGRCRAVLGCEGGASLLDPTGEIHLNVDRYLKNNPDATFEEVEKKYFPQQDFNIHLFTLSPRHFECAITKTCQILLEGDYGGIFVPGIHYIELKKDYSNIDQVIEKLSNKEYCARIADNAYGDIVESEKYTYKIFANQVIEHIKSVADLHAKKTKKEQRYIFFLGKYLLLRELMEPILVKVFFVSLALKMYKFGIFKKILDRFRNKND